MYNNKLLPYIMLCLLLFSIITPMPMAHAASPLDNILTTLASSTVPEQTSGTTDTGNSHNPLENLFGFLFNKILGPILNIFTGKSTTNTPSPVITTSGVLKGKIIVVDPGHGGSNPGATANNTRESDNNLAVSLKLRDKLQQAGATVIMTRDADRTVAPEGSSLGEELAARVHLAETNHAHLFISIHSNDNPDPNIAGAMTFYPAGKSSALASAVENSLIKATNAINKGTAPATFYVLRNTSMPSTLVEMGFVSNPSEAALLNQDAYRTKLAQGIANGVIDYFTN